MCASCVISRNLVQRSGVLAQKHIDAWNDRDKGLISYAVQQERERLTK
jgi:hypothetical protein